jgi:RNA polymerase sigma-B factor
MTADPSANIPPTQRSATTEQRLLERYREVDLRAREGLAQAFMPLARSLAGRYRHTGQSQEYLEQVAHLGLLKAIDRYDPDLGPFTRYAVPSILGELKRHFPYDGSRPHVPRAVRARVPRVGEASEELYGRLGRSPEPSDIAAHTGYSVEEVLEALAAGSA